MKVKLIKIASLLVILVVAGSLLAACGQKQQATEGSQEVEEAAKPSNPGGPGEAVNLTGDATAGATVYVDQ